MTRRISKIPYEEDEQIAFVQWCRTNNIVCHHSGNEIGGSTSAMKVRALKMQKMGTSKGFPDLLILIPVCGVTGEIDSYSLAAIEMKRKKGGRATPEQLAWMNMLELAGVACKVAYGAEDAIDFVKMLRATMTGRG